jgi:site-specific DNA-methyltransferase (adenine-specific)
VKIDLFHPPHCYEVIYADPPWRYDNSGHGAAENHYCTMSLDEIKSLPVNALAGRDAVLFLWATFPQLPEALETIKAWGFKYKTIAFNWVKLTRGGGQAVLGPRLLDPKQYGSLLVGRKGEAEAQERGGA